MTQTTTPSSGPLAGIRVLDLTLALAGPLCTQRLGDMGAEIIKIEGPNRGDFTRNAMMRDVLLGGETTCFLSINRNKKSVAIDLKSPKGQALFFRMVEDADVVIQNMRPGVAELALKVLECRKPCVSLRRKIRTQKFRNVGPLRKRARSV